MNAIEIGFNRSKVKVTVTISAKIVFDQLLVNKLTDWLDTSRVHLPWTVDNPYLFNVQSTRSLIL